MIVDDVGQMVGREAVGLHQHLHVDAFPFDLDSPAEQVGKDAGTLLRHFHPNNSRKPGLLIRGNLFGVELQAVAVVMRRLLSEPLILAHLFQPLGRAEAPKSVALREQSIDVLAVNRRSLALPDRLTAPL